MMDDFDAIGRPVQHGMAHGRSKLTDATVLAIRARFDKAAAKGNTLAWRKYAALLSAQLGKNISESSVRDVAFRRTWRHLAEATQ
jgi:hypothetical protein